MVLQSNPPAPSFLHMQRVPRIAVSVAVGSEIFFQKGTIQDWQWHCNVDSPPHSHPSARRRNHSCPHSARRSRTRRCLQSSAVSLRGCPPGSWSDFRHLEGSALWHGPSVRTSRSSASVLSCLVTSIRVQHVAGFCRRCLSSQAGGNERHSGVDTEGALVCGDRSFFGQGSCPG